MQWDTHEPPAPLLLFPVKIIYWRFFFLQTTRSLCAHARTLHGSFPWTARLSLPSVKALHSSGPAGVFVFCRVCRQSLILRARHLGEARGAWKSQRSLLSLEGRKQVPPSQRSLAGAQQGVQRESI